MPDLYRDCIYRDDRTCKAAPYYGSCDCEFLVDKDECPEPFAALDCIPVCPLDCRCWRCMDCTPAKRDHELREEVADDAHRIPSYGKEW